MEQVSDTSPAHRVKPLHGVYMIINANPAFRHAMRVWTVQQDAGYILDAPGTMPAGGCRQAYVDGEDGADYKFYMAEQLECHREENFGYRNL